MIKVDIGKIRNYTFRIFFAPLCKSKPIRQAVYLQIFFIKDYQKNRMTTLNPLRHCGSSIVFR